MKVRRVLARGVLVAALASALGTHAKAGSFALYSPPGDNVVVNTGPPSDPTVVQLTSDPAGSGYGGMFYTPSVTLDFKDLTTLSADYEMKTGTLGGGAPRFSIIDTTSNTNNEMYVYWGTPTGGGSFSDAHPGSFASTGNYSDPSSSDLRFYINGFGGVNEPNTGLTYSQALALVGNVQIGFITIDLDGGFTGKQVMITDNFTVGTSSFTDVFDAKATPEPATLVSAGMTLLVFAGWRWRTARAARG